MKRRRRGAYRERPPPAAWGDSRLVVAEQDLFSGGDRISDSNARASRARRAALFPVLLGGSDENRAGGTGKGRTRWRHRTSLRDLFAIFREARLRSGLIRPRMYAPACAGSRGSNDFVTPLRLIPASSCELNTAGRWHSRVRVNGVASGERRTRRQRFFSHVATARSGTRERAVRRASRRGACQESECAAFGASARGSLRQLGTPRFSALTSCGDLLGAQWWDCGR